MDKVTMTRTLIFTAACLCLFFISAAAKAQSWVQIESQPTEAEALSRAAAYAGRLENVNVFRTTSGWRAIALGPYAPEEARRRLLLLRAAQSIPSDAFISDGSSFGVRIFGSDAVTAAPETAEPLPTPEPGEETRAEARASERLLTREDRALLQTALQWAGFYGSAIDASFGPGTRRAMADWQAANGFEATGILTTLQRRDLVEGYQAVLRELGISPLIDQRAGIAVNLPKELVKLDRYESPFAHYGPATDDGVRVVLISQRGDRNTMAALYDIMQTLEIVPIDGSRALRRNSFTLEGANSRIVSHTFVRIAGDALKGFTLVWPAGDDKRYRLALTAMQQSFTPRDEVLPDNAGSDRQDIDLLSGLEIRRAERARSGFFIDAAGAVLTISEAVRQCSRITLDEDTEADIAAEDASLGLVLLRPREGLAPLSVARLAAAEPRLQSDIAVSGYSYGGILSAPSLTFGTLADLKGLDGDRRVQRLALASEPGDAGGPVFDGSGAVLGMLLEGGAEGRQLPADVAFAADAPVLAEFLSANGISPAAADPAEAMAPEDLTLLAADLTVLVNCWN